MIRNYLLLSKSFNKYIGSLSVISLEKLSIHYSYLLHHLPSFSNTFYQSRICVSKMISFFKIEEEIFLM